MKYLNRLENLDLLMDRIGWEVYEELDALIDQIYEDQQKGLHPDLHDLFLASLVFKALWEKNKRLEVLHKDNEIRIKNHEVVLLSLMTLFGASLTIEGFNFSKS